jgi:hypothetical protein
MLTVRFQVLTAANMKFRVFWDVLPCSQIDVDLRFQVLTVVSMKFRVFWDVLPCSQIDVDLDLRTQQYIPED